MEKKMFVSKPVSLGQSILKQSTSISKNISTSFGVAV